LSENERVPFDASEDGADVEAALKTSQALNFNEQTLAATTLRRNERDALFGGLLGSGRRQGNERREAPLFARATEIEQILNGVFLQNGANFVVKAPPK